MKYTVWRTDTKEPVCFFETDWKGGWLTPDEAKSMNPNPKPHLLTKEVAQELSEMLGKGLILWPASDEFQKTVQAMQSEQMNKAHTDKPTKRNIVFKGRRPQKKEGPSQHQEKPQGKRKFSFLIFFLCFCLGITLVLVIAWNIQPFIQFVEILASKIRFERFAELLFAIPFIGVLVQAIARFAFAVIGTTIYTICQVVEIAPMLYKRDSERLRRTLDDWISWSKYVINPSEPRTVKHLKRVHNNHPVATYQWLSLAAHVVYCFELFVCFVTNPPCTPAWKFPWYLVTFQLGKIDWINVALAISVLFLVQWLTAGILKLWPEIYPMSHQEEAKEGVHAH